MTLPIAGDTYISDGTYYHILTIATVDNEPLAIVSIDKKSQEYPIYAKYNDEVLMVEGTGVTKVQRIPTGEDENIALPMSAFSEPLSDGYPQYERVDNYVEDDSFYEPEEPVADSVTPESLPEVEEAGEPRSVPTAEATVEAVEKIEDATEVDVAVSVPDQEGTEVEE